MPIFTGNSDNKNSILPFVITIGLNHILMIPSLTVSPAMQVSSGYINRDIL